MMEKLEQMTNTELKAYIKANRNNEETCHQALKILLTQQPKISLKVKRSTNSSNFKNKLQSK